MSSGRRRIALALALAAALVVTLLAPARAWAGYTHYWTWKGPPDAARVQLAVADMRAIAAARPQLVALRERDGRIELNGLGELAHERFVFPAANAPDGAPQGLQFVKTLGKPYDEVVTACLLAARARFGEGELSIQSDGDPSDWEPGRALFREALRREPPALALSSHDEGDDLDEVPPPDPRAPGEPRTGQAPSTPLTPWHHLLVPALMVGAVALLATRTRGGGGGGGAGLGSGASYYVFWIVAPTLASVVVARPLVLVLVPIALLLRTWLPDPWLWLRDLGRARALEADARANPANVTARRDLARLWLSQGRAKRALGPLAEALARDPGSAELHYLRGLCWARAGEPARAVDDLVQVVQLDPRLGYGEPYLHAADALIELARWDDAEDALDRFLDAQRSSVEGWYKLALVRRARGDRDGASEALREARTSYHGAPGFHRRRHLAWFLRAWLRGVVG